MHTSRQSSDASDPKIKLHTAVDNSTIVQYNIVYYVIVILFIAIIIYYCFCCLLVLLFIILLCYCVYLLQEVMFSLTTVSLFVSSFMQKKLPSRFSENMVEGWHTATEETVRFWS